MKKTVFSGKDNYVKVTLLDVNKKSTDHPKGEPIKFLSNGVYRMTLCLGGESFSSEDSSAISYNDDGDILMKVGMEYGIPKYIEHDVTVTAFDTQSPNGQVLINNEIKNCNVTIKIVDKCG